MPLYITRGCSGEPAKLCSCRGYGAGEGLKKGVAILPHPWKHKQFEKEVLRQNLNPNPDGQGELGKLNLGHDYIELVHPGLSKNPEILYTHEVSAEVKIYVYMPKGKATTSKQKIRFSVDIPKQEEDIAVQISSNNCVGLIERYEDDPTYWTDFAPFFLYEKSKDAPDWTRDETQPHTGTLDWYSCWIVFGLSIYPPFSGASGPLPRHELRARLSWQFV